MNMWASSQFFEEPIGPHLLLPTLHLRLGFDLSRFHFRALAGATFPIERSFL